MNLKMPDHQVISQFNSLVSARLTSLSSSVNNHPICPSVSQLRSSAPRPLNRETPQHVGDPRLRRIPIVNSKPSSLKSLNPEVSRDLST
mmetsp:Transcript_2939/g.4787  ORF Transcript_2939/g.4787 Transcript_2939/m.4787 type:complete len:89 (-) Transcript_2939:2221-2487(-)